jgi:chromate transporter
MIYLDVFVAFFRSGILGYGGGPSTIPLVHKEVVQTYRWLTDDEFGETLAVANTLPGPIATKMAGYIGYRIAGILGMLIALAATVIPTVLIMVILFFFLKNIKTLPRIENMINAVTPVIAVMMAQLTYDFLKKSRQSLGFWKAAFLALISLLFLQWLGVHPAIVIAAFLVFGLMFGEKVLRAKPPRATIGDREERKTE